MGSNIRLFLDNIGYDELIAATKTALKSGDKIISKATLYCGKNQLNQTIMVIPFTDVTCLLLLERPLIMLDKQDQF
jgi:hypothetical protein